ncbi:MAG: DUF2914 domain-containing protein [Deltaproteobacteria bacterium]|nr:DUF2914 domain-containing protein [Deltaproteobacteria bacterium]
MKKMPLFIFILCILTSTSPLLLAELLAADNNSIVVEEAKICRGVINRTPLGTRETFPASVGKLYCFTKITNCNSHTEISHIWYFGDRKRAEVKLQIKPPKWRTYSSKRIQTHETGDWHVDIAEPSGKVIHTLRFKIIP